MIREEISATADKLIGGKFSTFFGKMQVFREEFSDFNIVRVYIAIKM